MEVNEIVPLNRHFLFMEAQAGMSALIPAVMAIIILILRACRWARFGKRVRKNDGHLRAQAREAHWYPEQHSPLIPNQ